MKLQQDKGPEPMRLNKYLAHAGVASRRKADELIKEGLVTVNGKVVLEMGFKVLPKDEVKFKNQVVRSEKKVYILINKPKDFITTTKDEKNRKTVMNLIRKATNERVYPVGRLDRNTTGLLLMTNDGELAQRLSHPSHQAKKIYLVTLDQPLKKEDAEKIAAGLQLDDGFAKIDKLEFPDPSDPHKIGLEIHIGKNRIVRRIFEHVSYKVKSLDRVYYAGLTKKDLPRGKWRHLTKREVIMLKHFS